MCNFSIEAEGSFNGIQKALLSEKFKELPMRMWKFLFNFQFFWLQKPNCFWNRPENVWEEGTGLWHVCRSFSHLFPLHLFSCVCLCVLRSSIQGAFCKVFLVTTQHLWNHSSHLSVLLPEVKHELGIKNILKSGPVTRSIMLHGPGVCWIRRLSEAAEMWGPRAWAPHWIQRELTLLCAVQNVSRDIWRRIFLRNYDLTFISYRARVWKNIVGHLVDWWVWEVLLQGAHNSNQSENILEKPPARTFKKIYFLTYLAWTSNNNFDAGHFLRINDILGSSSPPS